MRLPGVGGSRRIMDDETDEMRDIARDRPWDPEYMRRVTEVKNTFDTALMDTRFRIGHVTRQLLAQGKHLTMNAAEHKAVEESIQAMASAFEATAAALEKLRVVAQSEVWVSKDVSKLAQNMAAFIHAASDLDAARELSKDQSDNTYAVLMQCATVLRHGCDVLKLVRDVTGIELGVNNLGMSADEFKRLAGVTKTPVDPGPRPEDLPGFRTRAIRPEPMTEAEGEELRKHREEAVRRQEQRESAAELKARISTSQEWLADAKAAGERTPPAEPESDVKKCVRCGLDDPPRGEGILPVVEMRADGRLLCINCYNLHPVETNLPEGMK